MLSIFNTFHHFSQLAYRSTKSPHIWSLCIFPFLKIVNFCIFNETFLNVLDWGPKIDVVGFCFLDLVSNFKPPEALVKWLESGEKPIYIGFGSLVSFLSLWIPTYLSFAKKILKVIHFYCFIYSDV